MSSPDSRRAGAIRASLDALTGLRFVAALGVVLFHTVPTWFPTAHGPIVRVIDGGYAGVSLFFLLSGFILAYTYLEPGRGMRGTRRAFWEARFARIYPAYAASLLLTLPLFLKMLWTKGGTGSDVGAVILSPLLLQSWLPQTACRLNCPGWTLSVETLFYALFPFLGPLVSRRWARTPLRLAALCVVASLVPAIAYGVLSPDGAPGFAMSRGSDGLWLDALRYFPPVHVAEFVFGIAIGVWFLGRRERAVPGLPSWMGIVAAAAIVAVLALGERVPYVLVHTGALGPLFAVLILALAGHRGVMNRVLATRLAVVLGEASYSLYLIHVPVLMYVGIVVRALHLEHLSPWLLESVSVGGAVLGAMAMYRWIEMPARDMLRGHFRRRAARAVRPDAAPLSVPS